jgi:hypothetical protein
LLHPHRQEVIEQPQFCSCMLLHLLTSLIGTDRHSLQCAKFRRNWSTADMDGVAASGVSVENDPTPTSASNSCCKILVMLVMPAD